MNIAKLNNAKLVVQQLKKDEWIFQYNDLTGCACVAKRCGVELWVTNLGFYCDINESNAFGYFFRWWVYIHTIRGSRECRKQFLIGCDKKSAKASEPSK